MEVEPETKEEEKPEADKGGAGETKEEGEAEELQD